MRRVQPNAGSSHSRYVIQLDEDIELHPDACQYMLESFKTAEQSDPNLTQVAYPLEDKLLGSIIGVKLLHVERAKTATVQADRFPDRLYNESLINKGLSTKTIRTRIVGEHAQHRTPYELFVKCAVTSSKTFGPGLEETTTSDLKRFNLLFEHVRQLPPDESLVQMCGLILGIFNEITTDVSTYPAKEFERVVEIAAEAKAMSNRTIAEKHIEKINNTIKSISHNHMDNGYYDKAHYFNATYRNAIERVISNENTAWDLLEIGHGQMALAIDDLNALNTVIATNSSKNRQKNPTFRCIIDSIRTKKNKNTMLGNSHTQKSNGILIVHKTRLLLNDLIRHQ